MLQPVLARDYSALKSALDAHGYATLSAWHPGLPTDVLGASLGPIEHIPGIPGVQVLTPKAREASTPNVYSGNFGRAAFPLHTDLAHWFVPPRYLLLRCVRPDPRAYTPVLPWHEVLRSVSKHNVARARFRPRTPIRGRTHLLPFRQEVDGSILHRWDALFLMPDNRAAAEIAGTLSNAEAACRVALHEPADTLIVDNWRVLHGRSAVTDDSQRVIERVYIRELGVDG